VSNDIINTPALMPSHRYIRICYCSIHMLHTMTMTLKTLTLHLPSTVRICVSFGLNPFSGSRAIEFTRLSWWHYLTLTSDPHKPENLLSNAQFV